MRAPILGGNTGEKIGALIQGLFKAASVLILRKKKTIFEKIARREIPATLVHEEEDFLAFKDVNPQAPVHVLIVPKRVIPGISGGMPGDAELLGRMLLASKQIAQKLGIFESGYRLVINHGSDAGESVPHLHIHLLGGRAMAWPPG